LQSSARMFRPEDTNGVSGTFQVAKGFFARDSLHFWAM
jgi:hypothetical protein